MTDFDTIWKFLEDSDNPEKPEVCAALARVQAAAEQAEQALVGTTESRWVLDGLFGPCTPEEAEEYFVYVTDTIDFRYGVCFSLLREKDTEEGAA